MKKFVVSMAAIIAFGALATGCGKKPAASGSAPAASASAPAAVAAASAQDVVKAYMAAVDKGDADAMLKVAYIPQKFKDAFMAKIKKEAASAETKGMISSMGGEVSLKSLTGPDKKPIDEASAKVGDLAVAMIEIKCTKGALAGKTMDPMPIPLVKQADGWKVVDMEDKDSIAELTSKK